MLLLLLLIVGVNTRWIRLAREHRIGLTAFTGTLGVLAYLSLLRSDDGRIIGDRQDAVWILLCAVAVAIACLWVAQDTG
jgi:hypothetical protein